MDESESVTFNFGFRGNVDGVPAKFLVFRGVHRLQIFLYLLCSAFAAFADSWLVQSNLHVRPPIQNIKLPVKAL